MTPTEAAAWLRRQSPVLCTTDDAGGRMTLVGRDVEAIRTLVELAERVGDDEEVAPADLYTDADRRMVDAFGWTLGVRPEGKA